ncbi:GNAT family N-acetyltransferase [uncultured Nonlabens sp.]|uniref:GNAT family N-acetyltransferase n=1 Tax=uncultured Nonlabens sp. TaxID=859306 RepID=UPI0026081C4E|nr:GNAT family N-acetyltransferase [uncultured Nonlabens sp.]
MRIRKILPEDNQAIKDIIQESILEHGAPKVGTAYSDAATQAMYEQYQQPRSAYYVLEIDGVVLGGAGVAPLNNYKGNVCELQKMYFKPEARGKGYGKKMMMTCLEYAANLKFESIYLETMDNMHKAQGLYKHVGFELLKAPLGDTGHFSCPVQMLKRF